jgi:hypothetical protein
VWYLAAVCFFNIDFADSTSAQVVAAWLRPGAKKR